MLCINQQTNLKNSFLGLQIFLISHQLRIFRMCLVVIYAICPNVSQRTNYEKCLPVCRLLFFRTLSVRSLHQYFIGLLIASPRKVVLQHTAHSVYHRTVKITLLEIESLIKKCNSLSESEF